MFVTNSAQLEGKLTSAHQNNVAPVCEKSLSFLEATIFLPLGFMKVTLNGLRGSLSVVGAKFLSSGEFIFFHNGYTLQSYWLSSPAHLSPPYEANYLPLPYFHPL